MKERLHHHKGLYLQDGNFRSHSVNQKHQKIRRPHFREIEEYNAKHKATTMPNTMAENKNIQERLPDRELIKIEDMVDSEGYLRIDLDKLDVKGLRLKFTRVEDNKKRLIGLQVENLTHRRNDAWLYEDE